MGDKVWDVEVVSVDPITNNIAVKQVKITAGKTTEIPMTFIISALTYIKDTVGNPVKLSDIQIGKKIAVDYIKRTDGRFTAQTVKVG